MPRRCASKARSAALAPTSEYYRSHEAELQCSHPVREAGRHRAGFEILLALPHGLRKSGRLQPLRGRGAAGVSYQLTREQRVSTEVSLEYEDVEDFFHPDGQEHLIAGLPTQYVFDNRDNKLDPKRGFRALAFAEPAHDFFTGATFVKQCAATLGLPGNRRRAALRAGRTSGGGHRSSARRSRRSRRTGASMPAAAARCAATNTRASARRTPTAIDRRPVLYGTVERVAHPGHRHDRHRAFRRRGRVVSEGEFLQLGGSRSALASACAISTPFGPLRIDAAVPINPGPGDPSFAIYAGVGQAFWMRSIQIILRSLMYGLCATPWRWSSAPCWC